MENKDRNTLWCWMQKQIAHWFGPIEQGKNRVGRMS